jgi:hypothetical protein
MVEKACVNGRKKSQAPNSISINYSLVILQIKKNRILFLVPTGWGCFQFPKGHIHGLYRKPTPHQSMRGIALVNWQLLFFAKDDVKKYQKWHLNVPTLNRTVGHKIAREISQK